MRSNRTRVWSLLATASALGLPGAAFAWQTAGDRRVNVQVDGYPVHFAAKEQNGRVLVPLRSVMEQLGATVDYLSARGIINASRGGMNVQLRLGSRLAFVNGTKITLDTPAQEQSGSVLVPLRFVGEALGADVTWNPQGDMVSIITGGGSAAQTFTAPRLRPPAIKLPEIKF